MAENLKSKDNENEHKDKLEQMDSKLRYIKDLIIEEALRYANMEDEADLEKVTRRQFTRILLSTRLLNTNCMAGEEVGHKDNDGTENAEDTDRSS